MAPQAPRLAGVYRHYERGFRFTLAGGGAESPSSPFRGGARMPRTIFLILVIVAFAFLTRNEPSVVRASLVAGMMLIGRLIGRLIE